MGDTGIRDTGNDVGLIQSPLHVALCQVTAAGIAGVFHVHPLVGGRREAVVDPQECADPHFVKRLLYCLDAVRRHKTDLAGAKFLFKLIPEIEEREALKTDAVSAVFFADLDRCPAQAVTRSVDPLGCHDHHRHRPPDQLLRIPDPVLECIALIDQGSCQFRGIDISPAHFKEMGVSPGKELPHQFFVVVDLADRRDRIRAQMRADDQRLRLVIGNTANSQLSFHFQDILVKFRPEI